MSNNKKIKQHISFSEFSMYQNCPHQHLLLKYLKLEEDDPSIHLYFGNAIHESFEFALRDGMLVDNRVHKFREKFYKEMYDNMRDHPDFNEVYNFLNQGENIIRDFPVNKIPQKYEVVAVEEELYEQIHGIFHFKGYIDLVLKDRETGKYIIIDWKTSGQEWKVKQKLSDPIFLCQMRFYKFFWAKKHNIDLDNIDCKYIVLNRLVNKKDPNSGYGKPQYVDINSTKEEIEESLMKLAYTVKNIHIDNHFPKIKFIDPSYRKKHPGCLFCKFKDQHPLCNENPQQPKELLENYKQ